ncbi:minichromosome maintenance domain-containing protein 2-like isoform X2 [Littorina saxatilis]
MKRDGRLHQLEVVWRYLKTGECTEQILQQCVPNERTQDFSVLSIIIPVDLMLLADIDSEVANFIVRRPLEGTILFREVVHEILTIKGLVPDNADTSQLAVSLRIGAATLPNLRWACGQEARYSGLVKVTGVVLGVTATATYTKSTKYTCPNEDCEGHHSNQYVRIHVPGASEMETVGRKFRCCVCCSGLKELKSQRSLSDKLLAEVIPVDDLEIMDAQTATGHRNQTVAVVIRDDLCSTVQLGQQYVIIGTQKVNFHGDSVTKMFEVTDKNRDCTFQQLPLSMKRLFSSWSGTAFVFPYLIAFRFADQVCPANCFFKLKLQLLISLVLTSEVPAMHVLAVCTETQLAQRLMDYASRLMTRTTTHTSLHVLGVKATASLYPWAPYFLQAGSLVLSSGGVCKVGDLRAMKKSPRLELQTALTESKVQVALESRYTGGLPHMLSLPLSCQVWALLSNHPATTSSGNTLATSVGTASFSYGAAATVSDVSPALLDAFNLVCHCDVSFSSSTDVTEDLASHILLSSLTSHEEPTTYLRPQCSSLAAPGPHERIPFEEFKQYIQVARAQRSVMTVEAEWLLTSYLIATRHARAHTTMTTQGTAVPLNAWNTLQALSHGVCRLALRTAVLEADALLAVMLYEEALTARHGVSALNVFPEPHIPADTADCYITTQLVPEMRKFHSRLLSFCGKSGGRPASEE